MMRIRTITSLLLLLLLNGYGIIAEDSQSDTKKSIQDDKIVEYRQKLASNPNDIELHRAYQNLMREMGKLENVREEYTLKLAVEPQNPLYFYLYGRLLESKELEVAFKKAIELETKTPNQELRFWLYFGLGQFYRDSKKYKEALNHLEIAAKLKPDSLDVLHQTALVYYEMDNITEAMKLWDKILQTKKDYLEAILGKALIYKSRGMYDNAIKELESILKVDVAFWRVYEPLIQCYHAKKDYKEGEELITYIKKLYQTTNDTNFKKHDQVVIDIISKEKLIVVKERFFGLRLPNPNNVSAINEYNFEFYNKSNEKTPYIIYSASVYRGVKINNELNDNYFELVISIDKQALKSFRYVKQPEYQEILNIILSIEKK